MNEFKLVEYQVEGVEFITEKVCVGLTLAWECVANALTCEILQFKCQKVKNINTRIRINRSKYS